LTFRRMIFVVRQMMQNPGTILVVENGEMLRPLICEILRKEGYNVLEAQDGDEALLVWRQYQGPIDLVLTDVVMPNMSGKELVEHLRLLQPEIKVIYMSGYESSILSSSGNKFGSKAVFLQKPFRPAELSEKIREILQS
jgi:two-component system cell cycle sensor histidine kinase/response regulator CckA